MFGIKRREFITLLGSAAAWPLAALAQESERIHTLRKRVLIAMSGDHDDRDIR